MVLVALCVRLAVVAFLYPERLNPERDHWRFAGETGRVAKSLVEGDGFGNPFFGHTGPTAMMPPVYPLLLAGVFELFGVYSKASAITMLSLGSLFSALTCLPVFFLARRLFGNRTAGWAGWIWAFFPYAIYFSSDFIWPTTLTTLLLTLLLAFGFRLKAAQSASPHFWFGLLAGLAAMNEPIVLSVLPFLAAWMYSRRIKAGHTWHVPAGFMALGFALAVAPWFVRNYQTFHTVIPFRDSLGLQLYVGNAGDSSHFAPQGYHPSNNEAEMKQYAELGELAFMARKKEQALTFIAAHPSWFARVTFRRAVYMWTGYWSFRPEYLEQEPFDPPNILLTVAIDLLALAGLWRAYRTANAAAGALALVLFLFPFVYYVTNCQDYYRRPIDPVFVLLASYELTARFPLRREKSPEQHVAVLTIAT